MRIISFDFDGTIADSYSVAFDVINDLSLSYGYSKLSEENLRVWATEGIGRLIKSLEVEESQLDKYLSDVKKGLSEVIDKMGLYDGVEETLEILSKNHILIIASSNGVEVIEPFLKKYNLREYFSEIKTEKGIGAKSELLNEILVEHGIESTDLLYLGDEPSDISATKIAGCKSAAAMYGNTDRKSLNESNPDFILNSISDLPDLVS